MYSKRPNLILGFHGCDQSVVENIIHGGELKPSQNDYDWLGHGIYFWEYNPKRANSFAQELKNNFSDKVKQPSVIGAVIDLGHCLDLLDSEYLQLLKGGYEILHQSLETLPKNKTPIKDGKDLLIRNLDCAVIQAIHQSIGYKEFDSVRGAFWEGDELYPNAGFKEKNHIQICVRNPNCIKGYFLPRNPDKQYSIP